MHFLILFALLQTPVPTATPAPSAPAPAPSPTGYPFQTPPPVNLPYPAYGTPAPQAATEHPVAGVPAQITLVQAVDISVAKSPVLAEARANQQIAQIPIQAATSALFPNISATATILQSNRFLTAANANNPSGNPGTTSSNAASFVSKGVNASLKQLIYDGGRVIAQIHQARADAIAGSETYERNLETLSFNVAQSYYNLLGAEAATRLAVQVVNQNVVQANLVEAQMRAGVATRVDVETAELPVTQARLALVRAQGTELSTQAAFAETLGLEADAQVAPAQSSANAQLTSTVPILSYDQSVTRALALRPDFLSAQQTELASQYNLQFQRSGLFPSLSGTAAYGTNSTTNAGTDFAPSDSIGLTLNIPIYDQGLTRANTETAQAQLDLANAQLQQTKLGVETDVRQALVGLVSAQSAVGQAESGLTQAQAVLQATQAQYRAGVTTLPLLLNAQVGLTTAQTDLLTAVFGLRQAEQTYIYALGQSDLTPGTL